MKKYLLFAGAHYYPHGGVRDLKGDFDTIEEAEDHVIKTNNQTAEDSWGWDW